MHAVLLKLLIVVVAAAGALTPAAAVQGAAQDDPGLGIRLVDAPASAVTDERARQYIVDSVRPGTEIRRRIEVTNGSPQRIRPRFYVGGADIEAGSFVPRDEGQADVPAWSAVSPPTQELDPGQKAELVVTIRVPEDASAGERYGAVWAELPPVDTGGGISAVNRVGIRVYLDVARGDTPPTAFRLDSFEPSLGEDGRPGIEIDACNTGGRAIDLSGELELTEGPGGTNAGPFKSEGPALTLAPEQCGPVVVRLDPGIPKGPWRATATLRSGKFEESATGRITFPTESGTAAPAVKAKPKDVTGTTGGRWALLIALLLLLLVLLLLLWWLWRRRKKKKEEEAAALAAAGGSTTA